MRRPGHKKVKDASRSPLHVVVLAAGKGVRMDSTLPKVLNKVSGKPMISWVLDEVQRLRPAMVHVVIGKDQDLVKKQARAPGVRFVVQERPRGTADAARIGLEKVPAKARVLVVFGDLPLLKASGLRRLAAAAGPGTLALRTMQVASPHGYSRVLRDPRGKVTGLVIEKAATAAQRRICEVDAGGMAFVARWGKAALAKVKRSRSSGECPLTDLVSIALASGMKARTVEVAPEEGAGVNTKAELLLAEALFSARQVAALASKGALFADPQSVVARGDVRVAPGAFIDRNVILEGRVRIAAGCSVGPNCVVRDSSLARQSRVEAFTHVDGATLGASSQAGPFARLRPGTRLGANAKVGNFVEVKQSDIGAGAKANHLSYLGDGAVGAGVNIGAGTVFCNYDGTDKHRTLVGEGSFIGSGSMLVAPVVVGKDALVAAGSVITKDVKDGEMAFGRARQRNARRKKARRKK